MDDSGTEGDGPPTRDNENGSGSGEPAERNTDALAWQTGDRESAYECPGFSIVHESVTLPDGTETDFDYLHDVPSVVILPFTPDGDLVVIEEWRQAVKRVTQGFPTGGTESGESLPEAARRELTEETGYEAGELRHLDTFEPATGITDAVFHYFVATDCQPTGSQNLDGDEHISVGTSPLEAQMERLMTGELRDGRTALGLLRYVFGEMEKVTLTPPGE